MRGVSHIAKGIVDLEKALRTSEDESMCQKCLPYPHRMPYLYIANIIIGVRVEDVYLGGQTRVSRGFVCVATALFGKDLENYCARPPQVL